MMRLPTSGVFCVALILGLGLLILTYRASNLGEVHQHFLEKESSSALGSTIPYRRDYTPFLVLAHDPLKADPNQMVYPPTISNESWPLAKMIYKPKGVCGDKAPKVITAILTLPKEHKMRSWFRRYITRISGGRVRAIFPLGRPSAHGLENEPAELEEALIREAMEFDDLVLADFPDTYDDLPRKVILAIDWYTKICADKVKWLMKEDADVVMNWSTILKDIELIEEEGIENDLLPDHSHSSKRVRLYVDENPIWMGARWTTMPVIKDPKHRNFEEYDGEWFPPYVSGPAYLMNAFTAQLVMEQRLLRPRYFRNEDAMIGILLDGIASPINNHRTIVFPGSDWRMGACGIPTQSISDCPCEWWTYHCQHDTRELDRGLQAAFDCAGVDPGDILKKHP
eukprot:Protomagalhaensia_wolfi_Nauph_80__2255@NODE_246_length_3064_cov_20_880331_g184_i0_p1_GENE_NODE_246_length_3064_cov_20_880331_g184_i0NODE_246_length_3064_cov_20_880331_g184_i0_p1_ORF_typecomplete_len419_score47_69Galactosyl_T/PF01762_21/1_4e28_NODE_246_length_3064_cov_20_880331_g184_i0681258